MSVYKPEKSPVFHFDFRRGGRRFYGSTGCTSRREAEAYERREIKEAERQIAVNKKVDRTTIDIAFARFWTEKGQHDAKSSTTEERMAALNIGLTALLKERDKHPVLGEVDAEVLAAYIAQRRGTVGRNKKLLSNGTVNREIQILRRIMRRAQRVWRFAIDLPAWDDLLLPESDERVVSISWATQAELFSKIRWDYQNAAEFLVLCGFRAGNALPLSPSCVDLTQDIITVQQKSRKPGGKTHIIPITTRMREILLEEMGRHPDAVFTYEARRTIKGKKGRPGRIRGQRYPLVPETFYNELKAAARAIGRPDFRVHDLRHVAGTRTLKASGGNLRAAQKHLGHSRISTTTKYAHYMLDELRDAMEAAHTPDQIPETKPGKIDNTLIQKKKEAS